MYRGRSSSSFGDNGWSEHGGYMRAKESKLENQFGVDGHLKSTIFHGVTIFVNGYTQPPASKLRELIVANGGRYKTWYSRSSVTHVIASCLPTSKINRLLNEKLVKANWITESIKANHLLPWQQYQLYPTRRGQQKLQVIPSLQASMIESNNESEIVSTCSTVQCTTQEDLPSSSLKPRLPKQTRLDACVSPIKPPAKPPVAISLKQLLQTGSPPKSTSLGSVPISPTPSTHVVASTCTNSTDIQLSTFYSRSRLHHLSSWANELHHFVRQLRLDPKYQRGSNPGAEWKQSLMKADDYPAKLVTLQAADVSVTDWKPPRIIFHVDMDCFFVSVGLRDHPELKDKPVVVTHAKDSAASSHNKYAGIHSMSEIACCSYAARKFGVRNGMLLGEARLLCPDLVTLPYDFAAYKQVSETLYRTVAEYVPDIEAVSCDELYADCTDLLYVDCISDPSHPRLIDPIHFGDHLRRLIEQRTEGCTASIGFGSTRLLARLATKRAKPNGQRWFLSSGSSDARRSSELGVPKSTHSIDCELTGSDAEWLCQLPLEELPGIGRVLVSRLSAAFDAHTCGELIQKASHQQLTELLGKKTGNRVYWLCRARDTTAELQLDRVSKSVSACMNYGIRLQTLHDLENLLRSLVRELKSRMDAAQLGGGQGVLCRSLTVRVFVRSPDAPRESSKFMGHGKCTKSSRATSFPEPTAADALMYTVALKLVRRLCPDPKELRGLGLQVHRLTPAKSSSSIQSTDISGNPSDESFRASEAHSESFDLPSRPNETRRRRRSLRLKIPDDVADLQSLHAANIETECRVEFPKCSDGVGSIHARSNETPPTTPESNRASMMLRIQTSTPLVPEKKPQLSLTSSTEDEEDALPPMVLTQSSADAMLVFVDKSLDQLRAIFADWITSERQPVHEDLCILASYLVSVVPVNLERVRLCLLSLDHLIRELAPVKTKALWRLANTRLRATVDRAVIALFGAKLRGRF